MSAQQSRQALGLLFVGMLGGLVLALLSLMGAGQARLPEGAVARVNERYIGREDYARALSAIVADSGRALEPEQKRRIIERLIDEELLIQYGMDQGLVRSDRRVRANLVSAVIEAKSIEAETRPIDPEELRAFYTANTEYFSRPAQLQVSVLRLAAQADATAAQAAWAGGASVDVLIGKYGAEQLSHIPAALLPLNKLRQLAGSGLAQIAASLSAGEVGVVTVAERPHLLRVEQRLDAPVAFEQVAAQVEMELRRREAETALREELDALRDALDVYIAEERL